MSEKKTFSDWLTYLIVDNPVKMLVAGIIFFLATAPGWLSFKQQYDVRIWFRPTDPNIKVLDAFEKQFGNDESNVVVMHAEEGIFTPKAMKTLQGLTEELWKVAQIIRVESLTNYNETSAEEDEIIIEPFISEDEELTQSYLDERKQKALGHRILPNYLISKDGKSAMIFSRMVPTITENPNYQQIMLDTNEILERYRSETGYTFYASGAAGVNDAFREVAYSDNKLILPLMVLLIILYLLYLFRSFMAMLLPLGLSVMSLIISFGSSFYMGMVYNNIHAVLPAILMAICIADSVHILTSYFQFMGKGMERREALVKALQKNIVPTLLTSVSTAMGFFSLAYTDLQPIRELGLLAGYGSMVAWLLTMIFVGPMLLLYPFKVPSIFAKDEQELHGESSALSTKATEWIKKYSGSIIVFTLTLTVVSFYFGSKNIINSNPYKYFSSHIPVKMANDFVKENFGTSTGPELVFYSGKADGIKDPEFLKKVEQFKLWAEAQPYVTRTVDIIDIIKEMNQTLNGGEEEFYKIPDSQGEVAEELFLYAMGLPQGMDLNNRMTLNYDSMRMTVLWTFYETRLWVKYVDVFKDKAKELGLKMEITGKMSLFQGMMDYVVGTFIKSVTTAMILVGILMMFIFRSFKIGVLSLVPNILPLIFGSALMYWAGMDLNVGTALVASVCLGIAVDDTIHFLTHYHNLHKQGVEISRSVSQIFTYTGSALIFTTIILMSGFGLFILGDFVPNVNFGLLCAMIFGSALIVDLVFLPAILFQIEKRKLWPEEKHTTVSTSS